MDIIFDLFVEHPEYIETITEDENIFYTDLKKFVAERLSPLVDEINNEEIEKIINGDEEIPFTVICMLREDENFLGFIHYSAALKEKMASCFSRQDFLYIDYKISQILTMRNN